MINKRLKEIREKKKISISQMAEALGINERSYRRYEESRRTPRLSTLIKIATILDCSIDYLVGRFDDDDKDNSI